jgi:hypothetical protein
MNTQLTPPPDHDLRPATRNRQRDELIAIVDHESAQTAPRRRLVPLAAAAAVVAVTAGLAIGVPALRGDKDQPPVAGADTSATKPAVEPLTAAEQRKYVKACYGNGNLNPNPAARVYTVSDAFKWANPPAGTQAVAWVVLKYKAGKVIGCGFGATGKATESVVGFGNLITRDVIQNTAAGGGTYAKSVARITIAFGSEPAVEAVLRNGFYFAPMKYKDSTGRPKPDSAPTYTYRAYGADGKLVYASAKTFREEQAQLDGCYTNPEGTKIVGHLAGGKTDPPIASCKRGVAWSW